MTLLCNMHKTSLNQAAEMNNVISTMFMRDMLYVYSLTLVSHILGKCEQNVTD